MMPSGAPLCNICGEQLVLGENGEMIVACHECNYPICKACFEHEMNEGHKVCLKCGTPYEGNIFICALLYFLAKVYNLCLFIIWLWLFL
jgi:cellulose synthase A